jgi:hypothetical protein
MPRRVNHVCECPIFPRAIFCNGGADGWREGCLQVGAVTATPDFEKLKRGNALGAAALANFRKLLLRALRVPDVAHGFLVRPALFPRLAQTARGRFARLDPPLRETGFHGFTFNFSAAASLR